jgi:hypothetical protein
MDVNDLKCYNRDLYYVMPNDHEDLWLLFEYMKVLHCYSSARTNTSAGLSSFPGKIQAVGPQSV